MKLVIMGDLHYHDVDESVTGWFEARNGFYRTLLERFLDLDADAHISLGDLTNYGTTRELQEVYEILRMKQRTFYHALGNHDLYAQTRKDVLDITGQARYHAIDAGRAVLVFLDTAKEMDYDDWGGWIDDEQLRWFEDTVAASGTKPLLVFAHHPVYNTTKRSELDKGSIHPSIDMWRILSRKDGAGIYFNGHTHVDSIVKQQNWTFVQLSACLDQHGFRMVEIGEEEIRISALDVTEAGVTDHATVLYRNMKHFKHNPDARGADSERECIVSLLTAASER
ncbi:metallophosphoesterase family protein [Paenibacillus alkalitolerans]|uniref:metallophosphoesterase family protein n=1 Tax=Paenibacillus alkalitolerans TaxID=2799335 RepID=UPI0018F30F79|nr:metallophosphoesterase [Paenibacillus alkalitolerans]